MKYNKIINGDYDYKDGDVLTDVEKIIGYVDVGENASVELPQCTSIGGPVYVGENASVELNPKLIKNDVNNSAKLVSRQSTFNSFLKAGFLFADGILGKILKIKDNSIFKIQIAGSAEVSFCIKQGNEFSHGKTLKEARESFMYKISERDTSQYESFTLKTIITKEEAIQMYRVVTGACESGTRMFVKSLSNPPNKLSVADLITLTQGRYNQDKLVKFINNQEGTK